MSDRHSEGAVLVVEDDPDFRELLSMALSGVASRCEAVGNARQALKALRRESFALLILDEHFPGGPGTRVLEEAGKEQLLEGTRVLRLSGSSELPEGEDLIRKPFELDRLLAQVQRRLHEPVAAEARAAP